MTTALLIAAFAVFAAGLRLSASAPKTNQRGTRLRHWLAFHGTVRRMH